MTLEIRDMHKTQHCVFKTVLAILAYRVMGDSDEKDKECAGKTLEEIMTTNFLNKMENTNVQLQEAKRTSSWIDIKNFTPKKIIIRLLKTNGVEKNFRAA